MRIKYDISLIKFIALFERVTGAKIKDCFVDSHLNLLTFVVQPGQIGKAVGKHGANVKNLERGLKRKIRVIEFHPEKLLFIRNMIIPLRVDNIKEEEGVILIESRDIKVKSLLIGRNAQNLRNLEDNIRRYFEIKEIRIV